MNIISTNSEDATISGLPLGTIVTDEALDVGLLSDKAVIADRFFKAFSARQEALYPGDAIAADAAAIAFVDQYRLGKWDLFVLLDSSMPDIDTIFLFAFIAMRIGPDPEQHLFFEGDGGVLVRHALQQ